MHRPFPKYLAAGALVLAAALSGCASSPDITRQRVEDDLAATWSNQYGQTRLIQGSPPARPAARTTCDKGGPSVPDSGPGKNWVCIVSYARPGSGMSDRLRYEVAVRGEACYTAILPALIEKPTLTDKASGRIVQNPIEAFDGCFDVYDGRTRTKAAGG